MKKHLKALGLNSVNEYFAWCDDKGFEPTTAKPAAARLEEIEAHRRERARSHASQRVHHNPRKFLEQACAEEISADEINRPGWSDVCSAIAATRDDPAFRESLCTFLIAVERKSGIVFESARYGSRPLLYIDGLIRLHDRKGQWIRPVDDWLPRTHNVARQFSSLCRHLLARYPVPAFMDSAWLRRDTGSYRYRDWFIHLGSGRNLRNAKTLLPMTRKQAHHFLEAPDGYSIEEALLWGEIHALGGDRRLTEALLATRIGDTLQRDEERCRFWTSVYRFLIANPMLDRRHVGPIVDYLQYQKFDEQEVVIGPGLVERRPPPQPNLSMAGRTPESLLRQIERWHGSLRDHRRAAQLYFRSSGFQGLVKSTGAPDAEGRRAEWHIRELLSGVELINEGRQLSHCVASYAPSCAAGECSIWTMELHHPNKRVAKHLTLEIDKNGILVEARGRQNRYPTDAERAVLEVWCDRAGLQISRFLFD